MERSAFEQWKPREVARLLALVETERRYYQEIVANLPSALAVLDAGRSVVLCNRAFRQLTGLSAEDLRQKQIEQILPSDELIERIRAAHLTRDNAPFTIGMGERRFRVAAVAMQGWSDEMQPETLLVVEPIIAPTAPERAIDQPTEPFATIPAEETVEELAENTEHIEHIEQPVEEPIEQPVEQPVEQSVEEAVEHASTEPVPAPAAEELNLPAAIWQADPASFAFTHVHGDEDELLGYPAAHWTAEPHFFSARIHAEDRVEVIALYQSAVGRHGDASAEFRAMTASGHTVWVRETIRVFMAADGTQRMTGIMMPIGERRQLESQALGAGRIDALRVLASRLAHDLNNPLMIVTGYVEDLMTVVPEEDRPDLREILSAANRIALLAGNLLAFTRTHAKGATPLDLVQIVTELEPRLRELTRELTVHEVEIYSPDGPVWAHADRDQLEQAITALAASAFENTAEATHFTAVCLTIEQNELTGIAALKPGRYSRLDLHVAGRGTGTEHAPFESILPAKTSSHASHPTHPAGATHAYLNVRQWGGDVTFSSDAQEGSTFSIYLPYAEPPYTEPPYSEAGDEPAPAEVECLEPEASAAEAAPVMEPTPEPEPEPPPPPPLPAILVVEDEPGIRGLVRKILRREGYEVIEAGSAEDAHTAVAAHGSPIQLLLTDVMLPGEGGRTLAEALTAQHPDLKVVYVSGFTSDEGVVAGDFPPGSRFLQKPFTLTALVDIVKEALGH